MALGGIQWPTDIQRNKLAPWLQIGQNFNTGLLNALDDLRRSKELEKQRGFQTGEREAGQEFSAQQALLDRLSRMTEAERQRMFARGERVGGETFAGRENLADRLARMTEAEKQRLYGTGERRESQEFAAGQGALQRGHGTSERIAGQEFAGSESEKDRIARARGEAEGRRFASEEGEKERGSRSLESQVDRAFRERMEVQRRQGEVADAATRHANAVALLDRELVGKEKITFDTEREAYATAGQLRAADQNQLADALMGRLQKQKEMQERRAAGPQAPAPEKKPLPPGAQFPSALKGVEPEEDLRSAVNRARIQRINHEKAVAMSKKWAGSQRFPGVGFGGFGMVAALKEQTERERKYDTERKTIIDGARAGVDAGLTPQEAATYALKTYRESTNEAPSYFPEEIVYALEFSERR